jgi:hypothetical protein
MSEERAPYRVDANLLQSRDNSCTMDTEQPAILLDPLQLERMLLPLLNYARKAQGKRPVIVPRG